MTPNPYIIGLAAVVSVLLILWGVKMPRAGFLPDVTTWMFLLTLVVTTASSVGMRHWFFCVDAAVLFWAASRWQDNWIKVVYIVVGVTAIFVGLGVL